MGLRSVAWVFGFLFIFGGFLLLVSAFSNSEGNVNLRAMIGIVAFFTGAMLCYVGNKLRDRNAGASPSRDKPGDDMGGRPWWKLSPQQERAAHMDWSQRLSGMKK